MHLGLRMAGEVCCHAEHGEASKINAKKILCPAVGVAQNGRKDWVQFAEREGS
jgi:hypothetical protein